MTARLDWLQALVLLLPFVCLAAYWLDAALPVPVSLLPERCYVAASRDTDHRVVPSRRRWGDVFAALPDRLVPLSPGPSGLDSVRDSWPDEPVLEPVLRDLEAGLGPFWRARLILSQPPLPLELEALRQAAGPVPLAIDVSVTRPQVPMQALGVRYVPDQKRVRFDLLLAPEARLLSEVEVRTEKTLLFRAPGTELPADLVLRLSVDRAEIPTLLAVFKTVSQQVFTKRLLLGSEVAEQPRVLVVSEKKRKRSFIEALYPSKRVSTAEAANLDLHMFELVVMDGIPIRSIRGRLLSGLLDVFNRRTGSLLFVADSPEFGQKGDNPELEKILPVTLLPRSLKDLPDLAVLILIDVSGSMFGDKLSLAKVTGLELLRNLKPSDHVGLMLFSDTHRWIHEFQTNLSLAAPSELEPLTAGGGTDLYPALQEGLTRLAAQTIKAKHVVLVTDGITRPADFLSLVDQARGRGISISAMGVGSDADRALLERLALQTGGRYYAVNSVDAIPGLLFEDRQHEARAVFQQGDIPVLAMNGERVATIGGMAQYTPTPASSGLFSNGLGDPLLVEKEQGNRAVLFFGSDLYGTYTSQFFASPAAGIFKDRLDALFARRPARIRVVETARGISVLARSDSPVAPALLLSREGCEPLEAPFRRNGTDGWIAEVVPPNHGLWHAEILDRGGSLAAFPVAVNGGLGGIRSDAAAALANYHTPFLRFIHVPKVWLFLFFAASLACTVMMRVKR